jgi:hypothetical protein
MVSGLPVREATAREAALVELDALLALAESGPLDAAACRRMVELSAAVPGRLRRVVTALTHQRDAAAVEALLALPPGGPSIVEGVFAALRRGVTRRRPDGEPFPRMLALEFRSSSSRRFPALVERASAAFGEQLERIRVGTKLHYRVAILERTTDGRREAGSSLGERVAPVELDLESLHRDLGRLRGVRLWLNGWRFDDDSPLRPRTRAPLLRGWLEWARTQR